MAEVITPVEIDSNATFFISVLVVKLWLAKVRNPAGKSFGPVIKLPGQISEIWDCILFHMYQRLYKLYNFEIKSELQKKQDFNNPLS